MLLPLDEGKELIKGFPDTKVLWVLSDGTVEISDNMEDILVTKINSQTN